jgi:hypothetical protein
MERVDHDLSEDQWNALKVAWGGCAYCGATDRTLQRDCVLALDERTFLLRHIEIRAALVLRDRADVPLDGRR